MNTQKTGLAQAYRRCLTGDIACGNVAGHWIAKRVWSGIAWIPQSAIKPNKQQARRLRTYF
jgi:hypothetical protein